MAQSYQNQDYSGGASHQARGAAAQPISTKENVAGDVVKEASDKLKELFVDTYINRDQRRSDKYEEEWKAAKASQDSETSTIEEVSEKLDEINAAAGAAGSVYSAATGIIGSKHIKPIPDPNQKKENKPEDQPKEGEGGSEQSGGTDPTNPYGSYDDGRGGRYSRPEGQSGGGSEEPEQQEDTSSQEPEKKSEETSTIRDPYMDKFDKIEAGVDTATGTIGLANDSVKLLAVREKRKRYEKNKRKKRELDRTRNATLVSGAGNLLKVGKGIAGFATDNKSEGAGQTADSVLGGLSSVAFTISSGMSWYNSSKVKEDHGKVADAIDKMRDVNDPGAANPLAGAYNAPVGSTGGAGTIDNMNDAEQKRLHGAQTADYKSFKARKYALGQAKKFHENRKDRYSKGMISTFANSVSALMSIIPDIAPTSAAGKIVKGFAPMVATLGDFAERFVSKKSDENLAKDDKTAKDKEIQDYLKKKRPKVDRDIRAQLNPVINQQTAITTDPAKSPAEKAVAMGVLRMLVNITDNIKDRITLARIGVNTTIADSDLQDEDYNAGFEALTMKRAQMILDSSDKNDILDSLQLKHDAKAEDVAKALKGD